MDIRQYQEFTPTTWLRRGYLIDKQHAFAGLCAEAGEVAGVYQKYARGDFDDEEKMRRLEKELGGLMYYISQLCNLEGISLVSVLVKNRDQLIDRQNRGVIRGDGDDR